MRRRQSIPGELCRERRMPRVNRGLPYQERKQLRNGLIITSTCPGREGNLHLRRIREGQCFGGVLARVQMGASKRRGVALEGSLICPSSTQTYCSYFFQTMGSRASRNSLLPPIGPPIGRIER